MMNQNEKKKGLKAVECRGGFGGGGEGGFLMIKEIKYISGLVDKGGFVVELGGAKKKLQCS